MLAHEILEAGGVTQKAPIAERLAREGACSIAARSDKGLEKGGLVHNVLRWHASSDLEAME